MLRPTPKRTVIPVNGKGAMKKRRIDGKGANIKFGFVIGIAYKRHLPASRFLNREGQHRAWVDGVGMIPHITTRLAEVFAEHIF